MISPARLPTLSAMICSLFLLSSSYAQEATRKPNHLLGIQSPYLEQHIYNAVDWYPWGKEALEKAQRENKPIFLSVGYSTCYWCHIMARESFENDAIGEFMNANYVAIKVDRERRPDLDEQFMLATQAIAGHSGWPNSVFMTPKAKPFYAATYIPPDAFLDALKQIDTMWRNEQATLLEEGERISSGIMGYMNRTEATQNLTPAAIKAAADSIIEQADYFSGGLGVAPKFPQESAMLLLLDQAQRGNKAALDILKSALDGMLKGGIHDHVGGGFHRYAVDAHWLIPHFEKMLYNQALIGRLLVGAYELTGEYRYKVTAKRLLDYVIREMQDEGGGYYSAQDAESVGRDGNKGEGLYFIWSKEEIDALSDPTIAGLKTAYNITGDGDFEGENILHLTSRIDQLANEQQTNEQALYASMNSGLDALRKIREKTRAAPHKDKKILVSWNAMMIETMAYAASVFERPDYYASAKASADYMLSNMLSENQLLRVSYEGKIGVVAQLADHAGLGVALIALQDYAPPGTDVSAYTPIIFRLANDVRNNFSDGSEFETRAFLMTDASDGMGKFAPFDDNPIPSGNSLALQLFDSIARRFGDIEFKQRTLVLTSTLSGYALASPQSRGTLVKTAFGVSTQPVGSTRHVANGNVKVTLQLDHENRTFTAVVTMKEGWHINSNQPLEEYFVPTVLSVEGNPILLSDYPPPLEKRLQFNGEPLSLYEGRLSLSGSFPESIGNEAHTISLDLQACSDRICLEPETLDFRFWSKG